jgi:hypothetical protein
MPRDQRDSSLRPYFRIFRTELILFPSSSSSVVLTRLSGPRSRLILLRKSGRAGNRTCTSGSVVRTLTTRLQRRCTFFYITYINSVRTSQETQYASVLPAGTLTTRSQRRLDDRSISAKKIPETLAISRERVCHIIQRIYIYI